MNVLKTPYDSGDTGDTLIDPLDDAAMGKYFTRITRAIASVRGRVAQNENYFLDQPNRDNQVRCNFCDPLWQYFSTSYFFLFNYLIGTIVLFMLNY